MKKKNKIIAIVIAVLFFFISLGLILYPVWSSWYLDQHEAELELHYQEELEEKGDDELTEAWKQAEEYNKAILPGAQSEDGAFSQESQLAAAQNYGSMLNINGDSIMGFIEIPKIDVDLPIYHGTAEDTIERGAGHLVGSSLPIGGESTHSIITAHSGMASQRMFTDLEDLVEGDVFYIKVLGKTLAYQVDQIKVVLPHEIADLTIIEGEDYVTLITCTPYAVNTHRLLVRGTRIPYEEAEEIVEQTPEDPGTISTWERGYFKGIVKGLLLAVVCVFVLLFLYSIFRFVVSKTKKKSQKVIPQEDDKNQSDQE